MIKISKTKQPWLLLKGGLSRKQDVALLIDGSILHPFGGKQVKLETIAEAAAQLGKIVVANVYLDPNVSLKWVKAVTNSEFEPVVGRYDILSTLIVDAYHLIYANQFPILTIASNHARCVHILKKATEKGIETAIMGVDPGFSMELKNSADYVFELLPEEVEIPPDTFSSVPNSEEWQ